MAKLVGNEYWTRFDEARGDMSIKDICEKAGINVATFRDARARMRLPKIETSQKVASIIGVTIDYLMFGTEPNTTPVVEPQKDEKLEELIALCKDNPKLVETLLSVAHLTLGK